MNLVVYSPWRRKEQDTTEWLTLSLHFHNPFIIHENTIPPRSHDNWQSQIQTQVAGPLDPWAQLCHFHGLQGWKWIQLPIDPEVIQAHPEPGAQGSPPTLLVVVWPCKRFYFNVLKHHSLFSWLLLVKQLFSIPRLYRPVTPVFPSTTLRLQFFYLSVWSLLDFIPMCGMSSGFDFFHMAIQLSPDHSFGEKKKNQISTQICEAAFLME